MSDVKGYPDTGEHLDAQDWKNKNGRVLVGTEDSEMLARRLPFISLARDDSLMHYAPDRMELLLTNVPAEFDLSLHYVLAENPWPEPLDSSAWYAVDILHKDLLVLL